MGSCQGCLEWPDVSRSAGPSRQDHGFRSRLCEKEFGVDRHMLLGVALLLAAVLGALLVLIPAAARIMQQRMTARRQSRAAAKNPART